MSNYLIRFWHCWVNGWATVPWVAIGIILAYTVLAGLTVYSVAALGELIYKKTHSLFLSLSVTFAVLCLFVYTMWAFFCAMNFGR